MNTVRLHLPVGELHMELIDGRGKVLCEWWDFTTRADIEAGLIDLEKSQLVRVMYECWQRR